MSPKPLDAVLSGVSDDDVPRVEIVKRNGRLFAEMVYSNGWRGKADGHCVADFAIEDAWYAVALDGKRTKRERRAAIQALIDKEMADDRESRRWDY